MPGEQHVEIADLARRLVLVTAEDDGEVVVLDAGFDAHGAPHALQHLLHRLAGTVAGGRHEFQRESLAGLVAAAAIMAVVYTLDHRERDAR